MDSSVFDEFGGSSDFEPATKAKTKTVKKAAVPKAAPKKMSQPTAKTGAKSKAVVPKKRSKADSDDDGSDAAPNAFEDESLLSNTPPQAKKPKPNPKPKSDKRKSLGDLVNEALSNDAVDSPKAKKTKNVSDQYQMLTAIEHIIKRPDTYIGSIERDEKQMWVYNTVLDSMEYRQVSFVPGLYKIFDEILVNAADNKQNDKNMDEIRVVVSRETGEISVWNNGKGIPIEIHSVKKIYIPEMIFGNLLTSSNYDDDQQKVTGGRNGYGAKLANIFSTSFTVETADSKQKKKYKQTWSKNMSVMGQPKITDHKGEDYTKITFFPDFAKFGMEGMDDDFEALAKRRVYDLAGTIKDVGVKLNASRIPVRNFKKYMEMYTKAIKKERGEEAENDASDIITERPDPRWEVGFAVSDGSFQQVSFVNAIATTSGGTHVNYISDQICNKLAEVVKKKNKGGAALKINQIRNHIFLFVNCLVVNPAFTSQTKEQLTTKSSKFGSTCEVSDAFMKKIASTKVVENILHFAQQKADQILKKSDGSKRSRMNNPKLTDANKAGTREGEKCTLILTEGDSAKGLAMAGRAVVGPDLFGVFPLRGKLLNVRDASIDQISKNAEIQNIKNFLGLQHKKIYADTKGLRYGHLMIMTDQDHDGSHIKGLLINFLQVQFPSLLKIPGFLVEFITPIIKVFKGDPKNPSQSRAFFTMPEYEAWKEAHRHERGWDHKYYKGLGTSTTEDAQSYFNDIDKHHKEFHTMKDEETELIDLAFSKKKADDRKEWLRNFKPGTFLDHSTHKITYTDFVNKELILFSMADNIRSIPSVIDGLKPGQRKVLFTCFKKNVKKDMKVVELAGTVGGMTAYQHGEQSLQQTIVNLAQTFVGSNNINCLEPSGNFGSRLQGGSDSASARYIYTRLSPFARKLFHAADEPLLTYNTDDDRQIEPEVYVPVVPMVLVNGADGIGTGWSTSIPNYSPVDIVNNLRRMMDGEPCEPMQPWFRGFAGTVAQIAPDRYKFSGKIAQTGDTEVEITELPIRLWTQDFKDKLEEIIKADKLPSFIKDYKDYNTHKNVHFVIQMDEKHMKAALEEGLEERFKLTKTMATSNLVAFDSEGRIHKYQSVEEIMQEFFHYRLKFYQKRKDWLLKDLQRELERYTNQAKFVQMIIDHKLSISKKKKAVLIAELRKLAFTPFPKVEDAAKSGEVERVVDNDNENSDDDDQVGSNAYDYLLGMPLWSLTQERVDKLLKQIGDKQLEIDELIKLSKEDLWKKDLDNFIAEWEFQLLDEKRRERQVGKGRRTSKKFAIGAKAPAIKKRKGLGDESDESEFEEKKPKKQAAPRQTVITKFVNPPKGNAMLNALAHSKKLPFDGASDDFDHPEQTNSTAASSSVEQPSKASSTTTQVKEEVNPTPDKASKKVAPRPKPVKVREDSDEEQFVEKMKSRQPRNAAKKATTYALSSDSDNGDDFLGDVSHMVKGITAKTGDTIFESKPMFTSGLQTIVTKVPVKPTTNSVIDLSDNETDYNMLIPPQSPRRSILITTKDRPEDEDDEDVLPATKPRAKPVIPAASKAKISKSAIEKPKAKKTVTKKPAAAEVTKKSQQSPVAKAYAKRLAKKKVVDSDDEDEIDVMANDILDSPGSDGSDGASGGRKPAARPARRAAATKKAPAYSFDDESELFDNDDESSAHFSDSD